MYIFAKESDGTLTPHPPCDVHGKPADVDGEKIVTLAQAVGDGGEEAEKKLLNRWHHNMGPLFGELEPEAEFTRKNNNWEKINATSFAPALSKQIPPAPSEKNEAEAAEWTRRNAICGDLNEEQYTAYMSLCRARGLDPLRGECFHSIQYNSDTGNDEVVVGMSIHLMRRLAVQTGEFVGTTAPQWCDKDGEWKDIWSKEVPDKDGKMEDKAPYAARVGVRRKGCLEPIYGVAYFKGCARMIQGKDDKHVFSDFWSPSRAPMQLAKCASAEALRQAFPEIFGAIYAPEELHRNQSPVAMKAKNGAGEPAAMRETTDEHQPNAGAFYDDGNKPYSRMSFELKLAGDLQIKDQRHRDSIIDECRARFRLMYQQNEDAFWGCAWDEVLARPKLFGITLPAVA